MCKIFEQSEDYSLLQGAVKLLSRILACVGEMDSGLVAQLVGSGVLLFNCGF